MPCYDWFTHLVFYTGSPKDGVNTIDLCEFKDRNVLFLRKNMEKVFFGQLKEVNMELVRTDKLFPHEEFNIKAARLLMRRMKRDGVWRKPICIERENLVVMDGHHRLAAAKYMKLKYVPCQFYDYDDVELTTRREEYEITPESIIERALSGNLYPYKTTKHTFLGGYPVFKISLEDLKEGGENK